MLNTVGVALSQTDVEDFLELSKEVQPSRQAQWTKRSEDIHIARLPVISAGVRRGEIVLVFHVDHARHWTFKLLRMGDEVLRWDAQPPPQRHNNPIGRPSGWPRRFREHDHEHIWHPLFGMRLARPSIELERSQDHAAAFEAFCARANIESNGSYRSPPPSGEQLRIPS